jgi:hypothetical protein
VIYLQGIQDTNKPTQAQLVFKAQNTSSEGPGSPWGGLTGNPETAKYVATPIKAGETYHVVGILDGDPNARISTLVVRPAYLEIAKSQFLSVRTFIARRDVEGPIHVGVASPNAAVIYRVRRSPDAAVPLPRGAIAGHDDSQMGKCACPADLY